MLCMPTTFKDFRGRDFLSLSHIFNVWTCSQQILLNWRKCVRWAFAASAAYSVTWDFGTNIHSESIFLLATNLQDTTC